jgi:hypothetical protein
MLMLSIAAVGMVVTVSSANAVGYTTHMPQTATACGAPTAQHARLHVDDAKKAAFVRRIRAYLSGSRLSNIEHPNNTAAPASASFAAIGLDHIVSCSRANAAA